MTDVIIIHNKNGFNQNSNVHWIAYEESYKKFLSIPNNKFSRIDLHLNFNNFLNLKTDIITFYNEVDYFKNNYYNISPCLVLKEYYLEYLPLYIGRFESTIIDDIEKYFENNRIPDYLKYLVKIMSITSQYTLIESKLNSILNNIPDDKYVDFLKYKIYLDKLINTFENVNKSSIFALIGDSYLKKINYQIKNRGTSFLKEILDAAYFDNFFKKDNHFKFIIESNTNSSYFKEFINLLEDLINKDGSYENIEYLNEIIDLIKFINMASSSCKFHFKNIDNNNLTDYLCASFYQLYLDDNIDTINEIINFYSKTNNQLEFLNFYTSNLKNRINYTNNKINLYEIQIFDLIKEKFSNDLFAAKIRDIKFLIDDIRDSINMNKEIKQLEISIKSDKFKDKTFDLNKFNVIVTSEFLWDYNDNSRNYDSEFLEIYFKIFDTYFNKRQKNNLRKLSYSYDESFIDFKLGTSKFRMPFSHFYYLEIISKNNGSDENQIIKSNEDKIILNELKKNNLIYESNNNLYFNDDIINSNLTLNLCNSKIDNLEVNEDIDYDKDLIIDSVIVRLCKQHEKEISLVRLISLIRQQVSKYFSISDKLISNRIDTLIKLEYIEEVFKDNNSTRYFKYLI